MNFSRFRRGQGEIANHVIDEFAAGRLNRREFIRRHSLAARVHAILFSPAFAKEASGARDTSHCLLDPQELADWIVADSLPARLSLQIHKLIWDPATKGV